MENKPKQTEDAPESGGFPSARIDSTRGGVVQVKKELDAPKPKEEVRTDEGNNSG